ncbi:hypothetical protein JCM8097_009025 [Rhodosporidiobolus ruineniae]
MTSFFEYVAALASTRASLTPRFSSSYSSSIAPDIRTLAGARELASSGGPVIAVTARQAVVVVAVRSGTTDTLAVQEGEAGKKVFEVESKEGPVFAFSGFQPDGKHVLERLRSFLGDSLAQQRDYLKSLYYTSLSTRPLALDALLCGFSASSAAYTPRIYAVRPDSTCTAYHAVALGAHSEPRQRRLEERWRSGMDTDEAAQLALDCVAYDERERVDVTVVEAGAEVRVRQLTPAEISYYYAPTHPSTVGRIALPRDDDADCTSSALVPPSANALVSRSLHSPITRLFDTLTTSSTKPADDRYAPSTDSLVLSGLVCAGMAVLVFSLMSGP